MTKLSQGLPANLTPSSLSAAFVDKASVIPAAVPTGFIAGGVGNIITAIPTRDSDPSSSHVEGTGSKAYDWFAHVEGSTCIVDGKIAHAEGNTCICTANDSHAEGNRTVAGRRYYPSVTSGSGDAGSGLGVLNYVLIPVAEGNQTSYFPNPLTDTITTRYGAGAQADVKGNIYATGHVPAVWTGAVPTTVNDLRWAMHSVCILRGPTETDIAFATIAKAVYDGTGTKVYYLGTAPYASFLGVYSSYAPTVSVAGKLGGNGQHAEGVFTSTVGYGAHAEGYLTRAWADQSHAEGYDTNATGADSHAEGGVTTASGVDSHAEGNGTFAIGAQSHAEGSGTVASGAQAHSEGFGSVASGAYSHAEGRGTASGQYAHAEGLYAIASGTYAHAEGTLTTASGIASHASGVNAKATRDGQQAYASAARLAAGDNQVSRIQYSKSCLNVGWHDIHILDAVVDGRSYNFETMVIGRQTAGTAGTVGDTFAYKFTGCVTIAGGVATVLGTIARTLVGRSAGMSGDGLTTGVFMSTYASGLLTGNLVLRLDSLINTTFFVSAYSTIQELA